MLPSTRRIRRSEFPYIISNGKRLNSPHFLLYLAPLPSQKSPSKAAFSISKKIAPSAAQRNLYRRRGYAALATHLPRLALGHFCFFSYKKGSYPVSFADIAAEVTDLLRFAGLI
jgi:ribonuclease P protein component